MKIESLLDDVTKGAFLIKDADRAAVNALRRPLIVDVPKMAITRTIKEPRMMIQEMEKWNPPMFFPMKSSPTASL